MTPLFFIQNNKPNVISLDTPHKNNYDKLKGGNMTYVQTNAHMWIGIFAGVMTVLLASLIWSLHKYKCYYKQNPGRIDRQPFWMRFLIGMPIGWTIGMLVCLCGTTLLFVSGYKTAAWLLGNVGTPVVLVGTFMYAAVIDSKTRWPRLPWHRRALNILSIKR